MSKILTFNESGEILLSPQAEKLPEFRMLREADHTAGKKQYKKQLRYIYFAHDRDSIYVNLPERQRINICYNDHFKDIGQAKYAEMIELDLIKNAVTKLNMLQYTPAERHLKACEEKLSQYEALYSKTEVNHENFEDIAAQLKGSSSLFDVIEKMKEKVYKEAKEYAVGDYQPTMFEG